MDMSVWCVEESMRRDEMDETELTQELKEKLEFYLSDYSFTVKVERDSERDDNTMIYFRAKVVYYDKAPYDISFRMAGDLFELNTYEDNFEMLDEAALWRYLYITESNRGD